MVEWVEVRGKSIDVAVSAAMTELGISDKAKIDVQVIQEPEKGFLGIGGRDAIVRVKPKVDNERKRRRGRGKNETDMSSRRPRNQEPSRQRSGERQPNRGGNTPRGNSGQRPNGGNRTGGGNRGSGGRDGGARPRPAAVERPRREERVSTADPNAQAPLVAEFLEGLVESFGLEGQVDVQVQEDVIVAVVSGEQTEALVGTRGSVMEAIHEITKTVLHRQAGDTARVRLDVAGYAERRRQALSIYAAQLIEQVVSEGGEIMLEPMSAADRKVIHDVVAANQGVRSYSEGEAPRRYVVLAATNDDSDGDEQDLDELEAVPGDLQPVGDEPDQLEATEEVEATEEDDESERDSPDE